MPSAWTGYTPQGSSQTVTSYDGQAPGAGGMSGMPGMPFDPREMMGWKMRQEERDKAFERDMREKAFKLQQQAMQPQAPPTGLASMRGNQESQREDPLAALKAADQYEMSLRGAATRPTGLGAQMIPGMAVDQNLLPSRLRPQGASMGPMGPSQAGLSPQEDPISAMQRAALTNAYGEQQQATLAKRQYPSFAGMTTAPMGQRG